jgi:two-component system OmpR family sensor kinase
MDTRAHPRRFADMTLRFRLVAALGLLLAAGLAVYGYGTYTAYSRSQHQRLDDQLRSSAGEVEGQIAANAGLGDWGPEGGPGGGPRGGYGDGHGPVGRYALPFGAYAELRGPDGTVVEGSEQYTSGTAGTPSLPTTLDPDGVSLFTTGSTEGSDDWRVYAAPAQFLSGYTVVLAVPENDVESSLNRLLLIEAGAGVALLALLAGGSWLILRRGLRPLENMAHSASEISTGDLSHRVAPADGRSEVGQLGLALNTMLDEIETAFREREETEARLRQFLADASHELRTPLTSIQGFAELWRLGNAADRDHVDDDVIMRRIEQESARMKVLVEDLLLLARLDQPRPADRRPVDLAVLAADACSDAVATAPDRPVSLDAPGPVVVSGDSDHLRQAVANLVSNAVRHTPAGTSFDVTAAREGGRAVLTVRDHGPGLSPEALEHVFDRFWQADRARAGTGAGLGLSIVAAIAKEHQGTATAANHPDGGAVFTIRLPAAPGDAPDDPSAAQRAVKQSLETSV